MKYFKLTLSFFLFVFLCSFTLYAQLIVTPGGAAAAIANTIVGSGMTVSNATLNCAAGAYGTYTTGAVATNLGAGMNSGIVLTTGDAVDVVGPNINSGSTGAWYTTFSDPNLVALQPGAVNDVCKLEFDLVPKCSTLNIKYVFGSDEYPEFVSSSFNDAFGFFLSGPNPAGGNYTNINIATLPTTGQYVSIDNVNATTNNTFYVNNNFLGSGTLEYDGFTVPLTASANVVACQTYHLKIIIADAGDWSYDSGVFFNSQGLSCPASQVMAFTTSSTPVTCTNLGSATATVTSGVGPYTYSWSNGATTSSIINVPAGTYTVTVNDLTSCTLPITQSVTVANNTSLTGSITNQTNVNCFGSNNGSVTVAGSLGTTPYQYNLNGGAFSANATFSNLAAGTYTVQVKDNIGCTFNIPVTITQPSQTTAVVNNPTNVNCNGSTNGSATVTPGGGSGVYAYSWSNGQTSATATNLAAGIYTAYVINTNNATCSASTTVNITQPTAITATISNSTNVNCNGSANGAATVLAGGGSGVYNYSWSNGQTTINATGLAAGTYTAYVIDANATTCSASIPVTITQPAAITATIFSSTNVNCNGAANGSATVLAGGGTGAYIYSWSNATSTTATANGLAAGTYTAYVINSSVATCSASTTVNITQPTAITATINNVVNVNCNGSANGAATVIGNGGTGLYTYSWSNGQTSTNVTGLTAGTYTAYVINSSVATCSASTTVNITQPTAITATIANPVNANCNGSANGSATVVGNGGTGAYTYSWSNGQTAANATGLAAGTYTAYVINATVATCSASIPVTISEPTAITATISSTTNVNCNGSANGAATVLAGGGIGAYNYSWSNGQTSANATGLTAGSYTVYVMNATVATCSASTIVNITQPTAITATIANTTNVDCNGAANGSATVVAGGGTGAYNYSWSGSTSTTATATNLAAGTYTVYVINANVATCSASATANITQPTAITATITNPINVNCNGSANGSATVVGNGGTGLYTYSWSNGQTSANAINLVAGTYTAYVINANVASCSASTTINITQPTAITATISAFTNVNCNGSANGAATVLAGGGIGLYAYSWSNGQTTANATNLTAGTYTAYVMNANIATCSASVPVTITEPTPITATIANTIHVDCNGSANGAATVLAGGGTGIYTYSWSNGQTTANATGLAAGTYTAYVINSTVATCSASITVNITEPAAISATISNTINVNCSGAANGQATVLAAGGSGNYTYSWSNGQTTASATNLAAGTYTAYVINANATTCSASTTVNITQPTPLVANASLIADANCFGAANGSASVAGTGGFGTYTYSWITNPIQTTATATNLASANYTVFLIDANAPNCSTSTSIFISQPVAITANINNTVNVDCNASTNGSATVLAGGSSGAYTYSWVTNPIQNTATATNLGAGTYTVFVLDANALNCFTSTTVNITEPTAMSANISNSVNVDCFNSLNGSATVVAGGGSGNYTYSWSNGQTTANATNLGAATYTAYVIDANATTCSASVPVTISQPAAMSATISASTNVNCFGGNNGAATVLAGGGSGSYVYSWSNTQNSTTATNLTAGSYGIYVSDANAATCSVSANVVITEPPQLVANANLIADANCFGAANGSASVAAIGGFGTYTYSWVTNPVQTTATAVNLAANTYTVFVVDANAPNCSTSTTINVSQPTALTANINNTVNVNCNATANGSATVLAGGSSGAYTYSWITNPVQTTATATGLAAGNYTVFVIDANATNCMTSATVNITQPTALALQATQTNVSCNAGTNGSATITPNGGSGAYTYSWTSTPSQSTQQASNLAAGQYTVYVSDANAATCSVSALVTITQPAALTISLNTITNTTCNGGTNGAISVTGNGGNVPGTYFYSWNTTPAQTTATATNLAAGTYTVYLTDVLDVNCRTSVSYTVAQPTQITASTTVLANVNCFGTNNGSASVTGFGGSGSYTYSWLTPPTQFTQVATNLPANTYMVYVIDANDPNCKANQLVTITQPSPLVLTPNVITNVNCFGGNNGAATVNVGGGSGSYNYSWTTNPPQTSSSVSGLTAGNYTVYLTDANATNCFIILPITITQPTMLIPAANVISNVNCFGAANGSATVSVSGSSGNYNYSWTSTPPQLTQTANNLPVGTYTVWVSDVSNPNCKATSNINITQPPILTATASVTANVSCNGGNNGTTTVNANGGSGAYAYSWTSTPPQLTQTATTLPAGAYTVYISDANAATCSISKNVTITEPNPLNAVANVIQNVKCFGQSNGSAGVTPSGGSGAYAYSWLTTPVKLTQNATGLAAGTYTVWVMDSNDPNCKTSTTVTITQPTDIVSNLAAQTNVLCNGGNNGSATVNVIGGSGTYTYTWSTNPIQNSPTATNLTAGTYNVTINDGQCIELFSVQITQPAALSIATQATNPLCNGAANGTITANATNGIAPYAYSWDSNPPQLVANAMSLPAGIYTVYVTDANNCLKTKTVTLTEPTALVGVASQVNVKCFGDNTGSAKLALSGGTIPYTYLWNTNPVQTTSIASLLTAGSYTVVATDKNGCQFTQSYIITQPNAPLTLNLSHTDVVCYGGNNGTANVVVSGGTPAYTYTWSTNPKDYTPNIDSLKSGNYTVKVVDANNCIAQATTTIIQPTKIKVIKDTEIDAYCNLANGSASAIASGGTGNVYTYSWHTTPPVLGNTLTAAFGGDYEVTATDIMGCESTVTINIGNVPPPVADFTSDPLNTNPIFLYQATVNFINQSSGVIAENSWDFGDGNSSTVKNPRHTYVDTDIYTVTLIVYDPHRACPDTATLNYEVIPNGTIFVPTAFSPNGDGTNDEFFVGGEGILSLQCIIFDRWGKVIMTLNKQQDTWNGLDLHGKAVPEGVYTYKLDATLNDGHVLNRGGTVTIVR